MTRGLTMDGRGMVVNSRGVAVGSAIPDSGLDHLWWGPSISDISTYPDEVGALDLASNGGPTLSDINGNQASSYDGVDADHATASSPSLGTNNVWTVVVVLQANSGGSGGQSPFSVGSNSSNYGGYTVVFDWNNSAYRLDHTGVDNVPGGSLDTNAHVLVGTYDGSNVILDVDGVEVLNGAITAPNPPVSKTSIGQRGDNADYFDGKIGMVGHEAAAADAARRDELTNTYANEFGITI